MKRRVAKVLLKLVRWKAVGAAPDIPKYVLLSSPHTTNWDLPSLLLATWSNDVKANFLAKHQLFRGPMNPLMRALGGVPVRRDRKGGMVESLTAEFAKADKMALAIPAAGTRSGTDHWKSGFYHLALAADVPVVCAFVDYSTKTLGFGPTVVLTGDVETDLDVFRTFYADKRGKFPEQESTIRFRDERSERPDRTESD